MFTEKYQDNRTRVSLKLGIDSVMVNAQLRVPAYYWSPQEGKTNRKEIMDLDNIRQE